MSALRLAAAICFATFGCGPRGASTPATGTPVAAEADPSLAAEADPSLAAETDPSLTAEADPSDTAEADPSLTADAPPVTVAAAAPLPALDITAVAVDAAGTQRAALLRDGSALYWNDRAASPVRLDPQIIDVPDPVDDPRANRYAPQREPYRVTTAIRYTDVYQRRDDAWAIERAASRLAFSADGARLVAGMHRYDLHDGRDLQPLRSDEIVLDASPDAAIVARFESFREYGPGSGWCGTDTLRHWISLVALEYRTDAAAPVTLPIQRGLPIDADVTTRAVRFALAP